MVESGRPAVAVLAAGSSRRFGHDDKLCADFRGEMLGLHVVRTVPRARFQFAWVIAAHERHSCASGWDDAGFAVSVNPNAEQGLGTSVAHAARLAIEHRASVLMIALADMPLVPEEHFNAIVDKAAHGGSRGMALSSKGGSRMPPAAFGKGWFAQLCELGGDTGARDILRLGEIVPCPEEWLADVDTPEALKRLG